MDIARYTLGEGILDRISAWIGASPDKTRRGLEEAFPATMVGLAQNVQDEKTAGELLDDFQSGAAPKLELDSLASTLSSPKGVETVTRTGENILSRLFGGKLDGVVDAIGGDSGLTHGASAKILSLAAPLLLGIIGKKAISEKMDAGGLAQFVGEQGRLASSMLPGSLSKVVGDRAPAALEPPMQPVEPVKQVESVTPPELVSPAEPVRPMRVAPRSAEVTSVRPEVRRPRTRLSPWMLFAVLAIGALVWSLMRNRGQEQRVVIPEERTTPAAMAAQLDKFLASGETTPRRFRVPGTFALSSSELGTATTAMLSDVAKSLQAHPTARVLLVAYVGPGGEALAQSRVAGMKQYLVGAGIASDRIGLAGARATGAEGDAAGGEIDFVVVPR
jgi:hypothetical protein